MNVSLKSLASVLLLLLLRQASASVIDDLRIQSIQPSKFDYTFMSSFASSDQGPKIAFNDRTGKTYFAQVGEKIGSYTVKALNISDKSVYIPAIKANRNRPVESVILIDPNQKLIELQKEQALPEEGWTAELISLMNGQVWIVKENEKLNINSTEIRIDKITETSVSLNLANQQEVTLAYINDTEKRLVKQILLNRELKRQQAIALLNEQKNARDAEKDVFYSESERQADIALAKQQQSMINQKNSTTYSFNYGTIYRIPSSYAVIPFLNSSGNYSVISVPTDFESVYSGWGNNNYGMPGGVNFYNPMNPACNRRSPLQHHNQHSGVSIQITGAIR